MPISKACNLTEEEVKNLIQTHGLSLWNESEREERLERINYLHKRLRAFEEVEITADVDAVKNDEPKGWS